MEKFTRKAVREIIGDACTDEIENKIIALYLGVIDPMKDEIAKYKAEAEKLDAVTKERDELKAGGDYKARYEKEHKDFEDYKAGITAKEVRAAKEKAVRAYLEGKNIKGANLDIAMRGLSAEIDGAELDGEKLKDTKALDDLIGGTYKGLIVTKEERGVQTPTPPGNSPTKTQEELDAMSDAEYYRATYAAQKVSK